MQLFSFQNSNPTWEEQDFRTLRKSKRMCDEADACYPQKRTSRNASQWKWYWISVWFQNRTALKEIKCWFDVFYFYITSPDTFWSNLIFLKDLRNFRNIYFMAIGNFFVLDWPEYYLACPPHTFWEMLKNSQLNLLSNISFE